MADEKPGLWNLYFRQVHGMAAGWRWVRVDSSKEAAPDGYAKVEGAVAPAKPYGMCDWKHRVRGTEKSFFFKLTDLRSFERKYWNDQGKCHKCEGTGQYCYAASIQRRLFEPCSECGATGVYEEKVCVP